MSEERKYHFETLQLHVGQEEADPATDARAVPIYQTTSYVFRNCQHAADRFGLKDAGNIYGRLTNPTEDVLEKRLAALEGGVAALAFASGAAAVTAAVQGLVHAGQHIVAATTIYGGTFNLFEHTFPDFGIETTFVDPTKGTQVFEDAIQDNTQIIYIESVGNPNANLIDIEAVAKIAHAHKIPLVVDSTFATPYQLRPFDYGADIVVHSATKFIGGHGTTLGGVVIDSGKFDWAASGKFPWLVEKNVSYHGLSFAKDIGAAAFVVYLRALPRFSCVTRARRFRRSMRSCCCRASRRCRCASSAMSRTRSKSSTTSRRIRMLRRSIIRPSPTIRITSFTKNISRMAASRSSRLKSRAAPRRQRSSSTTSKSSPCSQTSPTSNRSSSIRHPRRTPR